MDSVPMAAIDRMHRRLGGHRDRLARLLDGLAQGTPTAEELHDWHRLIRRIRIDGRLWIEIAPRGRAAGYDETDGLLRTLARHIGSARNHDVRRGLVERGAALPSADAAALARRLRQRAATERRALRREVRAAPMSGLLEAFERPLRTTLPHAASGRLSAEVDDALSVGLGRLERALARAYRKPSVGRLHRLRIALRSLRVIDQTQREVLGRPPLPVTAALRAVQADLGAVHDQEILRTMSRRLLGGPRRKRVDRLCARRTRALRERVVRRLDRKLVRRDFERLVRAGPD